MSREDASKRIARRSTGKILDHPGIVQNSPLDAAARLGIARAYALSGKAKAQRQSERTRRPLESFDSHAPRNSSIGKQDLLDLMGWLRAQPPRLRNDGKPRKPRRSGDPNRTYFNKVNNVVIFLSAFNRLLKKSEYPKFAERPVVYYDTEQVKALYAAAKDDEERFTLAYGCDVRKLMGFYGLR